MRPFPHAGGCLPVVELNGSGGQGGQGGQDGQDGRDGRDGRDEEPCGTATEPQGARLAS